MNFGNEIMSLAPVLNNATHNRQTLAVGVQNPRLCRHLVFLAEVGGAGPKCRGAMETTFKNDCGYMFRHCPVPSFGYWYRGKVSVSNFLRAGDSLGAGLLLRMMQS